MQLKLTHRECMELSIRMARQCRPRNKAKTPSVGAVIAIERDGQNEVYAFAARGEDDHAEQLALGQLPAEFDFRAATVYTTLEPCTKDVRRKQSRPCAKRLVDHHVRKVVIGILDPNQGVCGKGVLLLQQADIEVELFPHGLAGEISVLNQEFIHAQEGYGIEITYPKHDEPVTQSSTTETEIAVRGTWNRRPKQQDRLWAITEGDGRWWPQGELQAVNDDEWTAKIWVRRPLKHTVRIVRANELGNILLKYYWEIVGAHKTWIKEVQNEFDNKTYMFSDGLYRPIAMSDLPKGLDEEAWLTFQVQELASGSKTVSS